MKLHELKKIINEVIADVLMEARLHVGDEGNLHGDERTQRQFVMDLAAQNPMGLISISDIANALDTTRDSIRDTYARQIRYYADREDFDKVISEVPFQSAAVYQLVSRENSAPLTKQMKDEILRHQEKLYSDTTGVYYSIYMWTKNEINPIKIGYLNIRDDDNIEKYKNKLPKQYKVYGEMQYYAISDKKITRLPKNLEDKIMSPEDFNEFLKTEFSDD